MESLPHKFQFKIALDYRTARASPLPVREAEFVGAIIPEEFRFLVLFGCASVVRTKRTSAALGGADLSAKVTDAESHISSTIFR